MSVIIPDDIVQATGMSGAELKRELAVLLFEKGKLSIGQAARLADMHLLQFQHLLASLQVSVHYDIRDFDADMQTLHDLSHL